MGGDRDAADGSAADGMVVVFDVGKTNVKLTAFASAPGRNGAAEVVAAHSVPAPGLAGPPYDRLDTDAMWAFLMDGLQRIAALGLVSDIVTTAHGCSIAVVTDDPDGPGGGLALPMMDYEWPGVHAEDERYGAIRPPFAVTGSPSLPDGQNSGRQLHYLLRRHPEGFASAAHVLPHPQYWAWRLSGVVASEPSHLGAHTDLWNPRARRFSPLADALGIGGLMGEVRRPDEVLGPLRPDLARLLGIEGAVVRTGIHDSNASLAPYLADDADPFAFVSTGTWAVVFAVGGALDALDETRDCLVNVDARGRPVPSARQMGGRERALILGNDADRLPTMAEADAVIAAGAMLLPSFVLGTGPFPRRAPSGLDHPALADAGRRAAAASLYAAMMVAEMLALTGARGPVLVDGNLAGDEVALAMLRAATGRGVVAVESGTSTGAATLARPEWARGMPDVPDVAVPEGWADHHARWRGRAQTA